MSVDRVGEAARHLIKRRDDEIRAAISAYLGRTDWTVEEIKERASMVDYVAYGVTQFLIDGNCILQYKTPVLGVDSTVS